jgi:hypothetical protein
LKINYLNFLKIHFLKNAENRTKLFFGAVVSVTISGIGRGYSLQAPVPGYTSSHNSRGLSAAIPQPIGGSSAIKPVHFT